MKTILTLSLALVLTACNGGGASGGSSSSTKEVVNTVSFSSLAGKTFRSDCTDYAATIYKVLPGASDSSATIQKILNIYMDSECAGEHWDNEWLNSSNNSRMSEYDCTISGSTVTCTQTSFKLSYSRHNFYLENWYYYYCIENSADFISQGNAVDVFIEVTPDSECFLGETITGEVHQEEDGTLVIDGEQFFEISGGMRN